MLKQVWAWIQPWMDRLMPPPEWRVPLILVAGMGAGLGLLVIYISNATSYMGDAPATCINCHIMDSAYSGWKKSSHGRFATCNDCHVPHSSLAAKYAFKAMDGMRHSAIFTMYAEPQVMQIRSAGQQVVQENCLRCHGTLLHNVTMNWKNEQERKCWECHREVPHGRIHSLAGISGALVPELPHLLPRWVEEKFPGYATAVPERTQEKEKQP